MWCAKSSISFASSSFGPQYAPSRYAWYCRPFSMRWFSIEDASVSVSSPRRLPLSKAESESKSRAPSSTSSAMSTSGFGSTCNDEAIVSVIGVRVMILKRLEGLQHCPDHDHKWSCLEEAYGRTRKPLLCCLRTTTRAKPTMKGHNRLEAITYCSARPNRRAESPTPFRLYTIFV
jgi:hypothetical protein